MPSLAWEFTVASLDDPALLRLIAERQVATELLATAADLLSARLLSSQLI